MQILTRTIFDFSMDKTKVVELRFEMEKNQNLCGKLVELLSKMEGTQNLSDNFGYLIWSRPLIFWPGLFIVERKTKTTN